MTKTDKELAVEVAIAVIDSHPEPLTAESIKNLITICYKTIKNLDNM